MVRRRKLEEEIARTNDPQIRKHLQELLDKRNRRWNKIKQKGSNFYKELTKTADSEVGSTIRKGHALLFASSACMALALILEPWPFLFPLPFFGFGLFFAKIVYSDRKKKLRNREKR